MILPPFVDWLNRPIPGQIHSEIAWRDSTVLDIKTHTQPHPDHVRVRREHGEVGGAGRGAGLAAAVNTSGKAGSHTPCGTGHLIGSAAQT